jgi:hypothetical protein
MHVTARSFWGRFSEKIRRPIRKEVLNIEQEVLHDYVREHSTATS